MKKWPPNWKRSPSPTSGSGFKSWAAHPHPISNPNIQFSKPCFRPDRLNRQNVYSILRGVPPGGNVRRTDLWNWPPKRCQTYRLVKLTPWSRECQTYRLVKLIPGRENVRRTDLWNWPMVEGMSDVQTCETDPWSRECQTYRLVKLTPGRENVRRTDLWNWPLVEGMSDVQTCETDPWSRECQTYRLVKLTPGRENVRRTDLWNWPPGRGNVRRTVLWNWLLVEGMSDVQTCQTDSWLRDCQTYRLVKLTPGWGDVRRTDLSNWLLVEIMSDVQTCDLISGRENVRRTDLWNLPLIWSTLNRFPSHVVISFQVHQSVAVQNSYSGTVWGPDRSHRCFYNLFLKTCTCCTGDNELCGQGARGTFCCSDGKKCSKAVFTRCYFPISSRHCIKRTPLCWAMDELCWHFSGFKPQLTF